MNCFWALNYILLLYAINILRLCVCVSVCKSEISQKLRAFISFCVAHHHPLTVLHNFLLFRFQTPYFWPSNCWEPENTDYAVYLCKRTMQNKTRLELADYEAENLARLQKMFSRKWEFIFMQVTFK